MSQQASRLLLRLCGVPFVAVVGLRRITVLDPRSPIRRVAASGECYEGEVGRPLEDAGFSGPPVCRVLGGGRFRR